MSGGAPNGLGLPDAAPATSRRARRSAGDGRSRRGESKEAYNLLDFGLGKSCESLGLERRRARCDARAEEAAVRRLCCVVRNKAFETFVYLCVVHSEILSTRGRTRGERVDKESERLSCLL